MATDPTDRQAFLAEAMNCHIPTHRRKFGIEFHPISNAWRRLKEAVIERVRGWRKRK